MERENGMIAIKGMKMPKSCSECKLCVEDKYADMTCVLLCDEWEESDYNEDHRDEKCPLVEIVTCKDCKHFERLTCLGGQCVCPTNTYINETTNDFYCKNGERRK